MPGTHMLLVGTVKGLFQFTSKDRRVWERRGPDFLETPIHTAIRDPRDGTLYAAVNSVFTGASIRRSRDGGRTWDAGGAFPAYGPDDPEKVTQVWSIRPGPVEDPGCLYAGVEASGLFRSADGGDTWEEVSALRNHPTHASWMPGFGGKCLHTIALSPWDARRIYVACSTGGFYRSDDGGASWAPKNTAIRAEFMPDGQQFPEAGQCVHKFALSPTLKGRIWLQNHGGVYRSDDDGDTWIDVGETLPADFGFPVVAHPARPDTAFVIPLGGGGERRPPEARLRVYRTDDGGAHWEPRERGLPQDFHVGVLRNAFCSDREEPLGLYAGTTSGSLFASRDDGASWEEIARHLPRILAVEAATLPE